MEGKEKRIFGHMAFALFCLFCWPHKCVKNLILRCYSRPLSGAFQFCNTCKVLNWIDWRLLRQHKYQQKVGDKRASCSSHHDQQLFFNLWKLTLGDFTPRWSLLIFLHAPLHLALLPSLQPTLTLCHTHPPLLPWLPGWLVAWGCFS